MSEVKRYDAGCLYAGEDEMVDREDGGYVSYEDYAALQQKLNALATENALIHSEPSFASMMEALDIYYADEDVPERAMLAAHRALLPKRAPATEAALSAIRAEGVIMFASKQLATAGDLESKVTLERLMLNAEEFTGQLRGRQEAK